ncbi:hypothetical protein KAT36_02555 [Candidatus Pacearchaeota archaeon]|nr:hypothetical protein [Candidatus Pacearchaeota archaeon]
MNNYTGCGGYSSDLEERQKKEEQKQKDEETKNNFENVLLELDKTYSAPAVWTKINIIVKSQKSQLNADTFADRLAKKLQLTWRRYGKESREEGYIASQGGKYKTQNCPQHYILYFPLTENSEKSPKDLVGKIEQAASEILESSLKKD